MQYADASAYSAFNKLALFVGTVKDAFNAGYDLNVTLSSLKGDGEQIGKEDLLKMGEKHIAVVREAVNVRVWDKVRYGSEAVSYTHLLHDFRRTYDCGGQGNVLYVRDGSNSGNFKRHGLDVYKRQG